jgi:phage shock protein E
LEIKMNTYRSRIKFASTLLVLLTIWLVTPAIADGGEAELAKQAWPMINNGAILIDVRTKEEFDAGHLEGAINIPWEETTSLMAAIGSDKQRPAVLYCRSGNRSGKAIAVLEKKGYSNLFNAGGLAALSANKP